MDADPDVDRSVLHQQPAAGLRGKPAQSAGQMPEEERIFAAMKMASEALSSPEDFNVDVTDADENDPDLLSELDAIQQGDDSMDTSPVKAPAPRSAASTRPVPVVEDQMEVEDDHDVGGFSRPVAAARPAQQPRPAPQASAGPARQPAKGSKYTLEEQIQALKVKLVTLKREGKMEELKRVYPLYKAKLAEAETARFNDHTADLTLAAQQPARPVARNPPAQRPAPSTTAPQQTKRQKVESNLLGAIRHRMEQYKNSITIAKSAGDSQFASKLFFVFKRLQDLESQANAGELVDASSIPPPPPSSIDGLANVAAEPSVPTEDPEDLDEPAPAASAPMTQDEQMRRLKVFAQLDSLLVNQITEFHNRALREKNAGKKDAALEFLRKKKAWVKDLELLRLAQSSPSTPTPKYHIETIEHRVEVIHEQISSYEMEIEIVRLTDVKPPSIEDKTLDLMVTCEIGYPTAEKPQKFTTPTVKGTFSPVFQFRQKIRIERNKQFERFIKMKKLAIEVVRPGSWFLARNTSIGKCEVKMSDLFDQSESIQVVEITEGRKSKTGTLEIALRLRTPLNPQAKQYKVTQEKILIIDKHFVDGAPAPTTPVAKDLAVSTMGVSTLDQSVGLPPNPVAPVQSPTRATQPAASPARSKSPVEAAPKPVAPVAVEAPAAATEPAPVAVPPSDDPELKDLPLEEPNRVDWLVSNAVIEMEMARAQQNLANAKKTKGAEDEALELEARIQQLQGRQMIIIVQIQNGFLTMEGYVNLLKERIPQEKKLAIELKRQNRIPDAKLALLRMKKMEEELASS